MMGTWVLLQLECRTPVELRLLSALAFTALHSNLSLQFTVSTHDKQSTRPYSPLPSSLSPHINRQKRRYHACSTSLAGLLPGTQVRNQPISRHPLLTNLDSRNSDPLLYNLQKSSRSRRCARRPLRSTFRLAVGYQARREAGEGGLGRYLLLGIWWKFGVGDCGLCVQA